MSLDPGRFARDEALVGRLLGAGVSVSAACLLAGLGAWLAAAPPWLGDALLRAGLLVLMATPVARVIVSVVEAVRARDWFLLVTAGTVLLVLAATIAAAWRAGVAH
jgi:uncharacterized membrane protein